MIIKLNKQVMNERRSYGIPRRCRAESASAFLNVQWKTRQKSMEDLQNKRKN